MKNRLQIRYHIPESLPTRAQAMAYLQEAFAIGRTNTENTSLPGEPLVLLYNDTLLDIANGITEAQRLETANVLLAIGRGGDGVIHCMVQEVCSEKALNKSLPISLAALVFSLLCCRLSWWLRQ